MSINAMDAKAADGPFEASAPLDDEQLTESEELDGDLGQQPGELTDEFAQG